MPIASPQDGTSQSSVQRFRRVRRKFVKNAGRSLTRRLANFLGRQSLVEDQPIVPAHHFPFLQNFTGNWQMIQKEAREILRHRDAIPAFQEISPDQHKLATGKNWRKTAGKRPRRRVSWKLCQICNPPGFQY
jgi:aspartyl/asparaginyl beta-hydroxylase (cupin superfamily)